MYLYWQKKLTWHSRLALVGHCVVYMCSTDAGCRPVVKVDNCRVILGCPCSAGTWTCFPTPPLLLPAPRSPASDPPCCRLSSQRGRMHKTWRARRRWEPRLPFCPHRGKHKGLWLWHDRCILQCFYAIIFFHHAHLMQRMCASFYFCDVMHAGVIFECKVFFMHIIGNVLLWLKFALFIFSPVFTKDLLILNSVAFS